MSRKKSILFVRPDYHCSFFYRDEFRKQGWKADIIVDSSYPRNLLYSDRDIITPPLIKVKGRWFSLMNQFVMFFWWHTIFWRYEIHLYYGRSPINELGKLMERVFPFQKIIGSDFCWELWIARKFGIKLIFLPSGCFDSDLKSTWQTFDKGNVCDNCGFFDRCDDRVNSLYFDLIRKYFDITIGIEWKISKEISERYIKWKCIDLNLWRPDLEIPKEHQIEPTQNIRILHSAYLEKSGRNWKGKNIKGSPYVLKAIERLRSEGYQVEYIYISDKPSNQMRFYQAQADIVVEQLIYGWWGSTGVETMALGKPVICYLRPSWKSFFLKTFPEYQDLPVISATVDTVYKEIKKLVENESFRKQKGIESREFAERHFNPVENTKKLIETIESL